MISKIPSVDLLTELFSGNTRVIARLISYAESERAIYANIFAEIYRKAGTAHIIGITGVAGSGKSTLVRSLVKIIRDTGQTVGVIAVDPSSPFSGGAILGDRIRMLDIVNDPGVFIRSMATRGVLGGLAQSTYDAIDILDAAGFDVVLIETVGVGQDEVDIVQAAHSVVVVSAPGLGDDIQAIKAGILEIADIHVVSKGDRSDANKTFSELKQMLAMNFEESWAGNWAVPILATSANNDLGIADLFTALNSHRKFLLSSEEQAKRSRRIAVQRILKIAQGLVMDGITMTHDNVMQDLLDQVMARQTDPSEAALKLLARINGNQKND